MLYICHYYIGDFVQRQTMTGSTEICVQAAVVPKFHYHKRKICFSQQNCIQQTIKCSRNTKTGYEQTKKN